MSADSRLTENFRDCPDDELEAALLVNRALAPEVNIVALRAGVEELVAGCDQPDAPWAYLKALGFRGNRENFSAAENSRLDTVLALRRGIPISLGVLLIHLARSQGRRACGINFPGHFLVRVEDQLIDPFQMSVTNEQECLTQQHTQVGDNPFAVASARGVASRMLNNLKYHYAALTRWDLALDMLDYQIALAPDNASLFFERGQFWLRIGAVDAARDSFKLCLDGAEGARQLERLATEQLRLLGASTDTLH